MALMICSIGGHAHDSDVPFHLILENFSAYCSLVCTYIILRDMV